MVAGLFRNTGSTELKVNPRSVCVEAERPFIAAFNELTLKKCLFLIYNIIIY